MTTNHIDHLAQWWETAERGPVEKGDTVIKRHPDGRYTIREAEKGWENTNYRILSRAPKPKPTWHDAPAIIATYRYENDVVTGVWTPECEPGYWENIEGYIVASEALEDVTPLIEAKVTDDMHNRATRAVINWEYRPHPETTILLDLGDKGSRALADHILAAALNIEDPV